MGTSRAAATGYFGATAALALCAVLPLAPALRVLLPAGRLLGGGPAPEAAMKTAVLALLSLGCEHAGRWQRVMRRQEADGADWRNESAEVTAVWAPYFPVLLAGVLLLPPAAAALVPLPGMLLAARVAHRRGQRAGRPLWNAAQLGLSAALAGVVFRLLDGPRMLAAAQPDPLGHALPLPALLPPTWLATLTFVAVSAALVARARAVAGDPERRAGRRGLLRGGLLPALGHGLIGLLMAVLWQGPYGAFAAALVLLPLSVSGWVLAQYRREQAAHRATVRALVQAVEIKDEYTRGHSERVGRAAVLMARELLMAEERIASLRIAGTLHDVGKLGVPTRVLRKNGPLTARERAAIELHPEYGHEMVRGISFLGEAQEGILHHHERYDGQGYPYGLAGSAIPEFARVIAVADAFDSMTSTRSYRRGRPVHEAIAELRRCAGRQFDPAMVRALVGAVERHGWRVSRAPVPGVGDLSEVPDIPLGVPEPGGERGEAARVRRTPTGCPE